jgi:hypothetical protein
MDSKRGSLSDWDGSSLVGEIDEDFADTFCPCHEDSKLEIRRFQNIIPDSNATEIESDQPTSISNLAKLSDFAVSCQFLEIYVPSSRF